jgi:hypothetical protein
MVSVQINPNDDVFLDSGHLQQSTQLFIGAKSTQHGIQAPPFVQTMYLESGAMSDPGSNFWQQAQTKIGITEAPTAQPFADVNNKLNSQWATWMQKW